MQQLLECVVRKRERNNSAGRKIEGVLNTLEKRFPLQPMEYLGRADLHVQPRKKPVH